ncbi:MAG: Bug family tripartite tricarboxylate transporter substrate binding protein [Burkholderiales bacterium]
MSAGAIGQRGIVAAAFALALAAGEAHAQNSSPSSGQGFPSKPIRIVISTTAGSQPDGIARIIGQKLSETWGRPVVIENRPGAGGMIAASMAAKATPDGHTLFYALPNFAISPVLQASVPYDPVKDFAHITQIGMSTNLLVAGLEVGAKSVKELVAIAKAQPGKMIFGSSAIGSAAHLTGARFNHVAGIKVVTVAFKGGPEAAIEVLAGRTHYHAGTLGVLLPFVKDGKLVALAVTSPQRTPALPDVPALAETMPEFKRPETSHGLLAPAGTPPPIVNQVNKEMARILDLPDVKERLQKIGYVIAPTSPEEHRDIVRGQIETLSRLVADAGLRPK